MGGFHAVLTGASGGIGSEIAAALAPHCAHLIVAGRDKDRLSILRGRLHQRNPSLRIAIVTGDVVNESTLKAIQQAAIAEGRLDLLINNAGINEFHEFETQDAVSIARQLQVNLHAPIAVSHLLLPLLKTATGAQIINVGSMLGYIGYPGYATYCATKFGLRGFTEALRRELSDSSVRVRYFAPRTTATKLNSRAVCAMQRELRMAEDSPRAVAERLVRFVFSNKGEYRIGFPDAFYAFLNQLVPTVTDRAIAGQRRIIRKYLVSRTPPGPREPAALLSEGPVKNGEKT